MANIEKFAELIVKECAKSIRADLGKFPINDLAWRCAMEQAAFVVENHFVVN